MKQNEMTRSVQIGIEDMPSMHQPFFTLRQAWVLKGCCCSWDSFRRYPYIQPKGGHFDTRIGGRGVFTNETIMEWLYLSDKDMEDYNKKYETGAKARGSVVKKKDRFNYSDYKTA